MHDLHELPHAPPEREADAAPRGPAEPVATRSHHRDREEHEEQAAREHPGRDLEEHGHVQHVADDVEQVDRHAEDEGGLERAQEQLPRGTVIGEAIALDLGLGEKITPQARLGPEVIDPERDDRQQRVDDVDPEERAAPAVEDRPAHGAGGRRGRALGGAGRERRRRRWRGRRRCRRRWRYRRRRDRAAGSGDSRRARACGRTTVAPRIPARPYAPTMGGTRAASQLLVIDSRWPRTAPGDARRRRRAGRSWSAAGTCG